MFWQQIETRLGSVLSFKCGSYAADCKRSQRDQHYLEWTAFRPEGKAMLKPYGPWVQLHPETKIPDEKINFALGQLDRLIANRDH